MSQPKTTALSHLPIDPYAMLKITLMELIKTKPTLAKAISQTILNWPTSPINVKHNCFIFEKLNPDGLLVSGLDKNCDYYKICCEYAYITLALKQRGLMNMAYYLAVDDLVNALSNNNKSKIQNGGANLQTLITMVLICYLLLGKTEGLGEVSTTLGEPDGSRVPKTTVSVFKSDVAPVETVGELLPYREQQARNILSTMMEVSPWILPEESLVIANNLSQGQIDYFSERISELNANLQSISRNARTYCSQISTKLSYTGIFSDQDFYDKVVSVANKDKEAQQQKTKSEVVQSSFSYFTTGTANVANAFVKGVIGNSVSKNVDESGALSRAYADEIAKENQKISKQVEKTAYSITYTNLCKQGTPVPKYILNTTNSSITMNIQFGNHHTGELLLAHMYVQQKIDDKMESIQNKKSDEYQALQSLRERIEIEKQLIESSSLFVPLDIHPGIESYVSAIAEGETQVSSFENIVKQINEIFPISKANFEAQLATQRALDEMTKGKRDLVREQWKALAKNTVSTLTDQVSVLIDAGAELTQQTATTLLNATANIANEGLDRVGNITNKAVEGATDVLVTATEGATKVGTELARGATDVGTELARGTTEIALNLSEGIGKVGKELIMKNLPVFSAVFGIIGTFMIMTVWYKKEMLSFPQNQQQKVNDIMIGNQHQQIDPQVAKIAYLENQIKIAKLERELLQITNSPHTTNALQITNAPQTDAQLGGKKYTRNKKSKKSKKSTKSGTRDRSSRKNKKNKEL